jgi:hypothetical protein
MLTAGDSTAAVRLQRKRGDGRRRRRRRRRRRKRRRPSRWWWCRGDGEDDDEKEWGKVYSEETRGPATRSTRAPGAAAARIRASAKGTTDGCAHCGHDMVKLQQ